MLRILVYSAALAVVAVGAIGLYGQLGSSPFAVLTFAPSDAQAADAPAAAAAAPNTSAAAGSAAQAQPSDPTAGDGGMRRFRGWGQGFRRGFDGMMRPRGEEAAAAVDEARPEDWADMMKFMEENSPNRAAILKRANLPQGSPARGLALKRWRTYRLMKDSAPRLAELALQKLQVEDKILGITIQLRKNPGKRESFREDVRALATRLVDLSRQEQELRIQNLTKLLEDEKTRLAREDGQRDQMIDDRTERILNHGVGFGGGGGGFGGGGPFFPGGPPPGPRGDAGDATDAPATDSPVAVGGQAPSDAPAPVH